MEQDLFEFAIPPVPEVRLPKPAFDPRFYQSEAVDNAFEAWDSGAVGCLLVQATGTGKTATGCFIVKRWLEQGPDYRVLVVLHERPLFYQFSDDIEKILRVTPGLEAGADHRLQLPIPKIVVAMRQSLVDRVRNGQIVSRLGKYDTDKKYLLILDEAHRYKKGLKQVAPILERFTDARRLLLTATPERGDKVSLASLGEVVVADYPHTSLDGRPSACGDGFVVDFEQHFVTINSVDLQKVKGHKSRDWSAEDLSDKLSQVRALDEIIQPSLDIVQDKKSLVFCVDRAMSKALVDRINHKYIPGAARWIDATLPMEERKEILAAHKANEFQFLCVVGLCREGYNDPYIEAVVCARPTKSASLAEQMKGRGCRVLPGVIDGLDTREERLEAIRNSGKPKCIAKGSLVLTDQGEVPIEEITTQMKVWDGVEFVSHLGVASQGIQQVITYSGLTATPDHKVMTHDGQWTTLTEAARKQTPLRAATTKGKKGRDIDHRHWVCVTKEREAHVVGNMRLRLGVCQTPRLPYLRKVGLLQVCCGKEADWRATMASEKDRQHKKAMHKPKRSVISQLRREGDKVRFSVSQFNGDMGTGELRGSPRTSDRPNRQQRALRTGQYSVRNCTAEHEQHEAKAGYAGTSCVYVSASRSTVCSNVHLAVAEEGGYVGECVREVRSMGKDKIHGRKKEVYDIINAGPRHRFAVSGAIVHNCIVVDLVGATGLAGNQTVASVLAKGLPDHLVDLVTERANLLAKEASTELSLKEIVEKTAEDLLEEDRIAEEMVERERLRYIENQIDAARLAGLTLDVDYTSKIVDQGEGTVLKFKRPEMRVSNGKYKGKLLSRVPTGYIEFMVGKLKPGWYRSKFVAELKYRKPQL